MSTKEKIFIESSENGKNRTENPLERLAAGVLRQAYVDYVTAYAFLEARRISGGGSENPTARKRAEALLNRKRALIRRSAMKECNRRGIVCLDGYKDFGEYVEVRLFAEESYAKGAMKEVERFCRSERFYTFARNIEGEWLLKMAQKNVSDYFSGRRKTYRLMFTRETLEEL